MTFSVFYLLGLGDLVLGLILSGEDVRGRRRLTKPENLPSSLSSGFPLGNDGWVGVGWVGGPAT